MRKLRLKEHKALPQVTQQISCGLRTGPGLLKSHHTGSWRHKECDHQCHLLFHSSHKVLHGILTIRLYIELHLHSWACTSQSWPVLQRNRKYNSLPTETEQIKTLSENSEETSIGRFLCVTWSSWWKFSDPRGTHSFPKTKKAGAYRTPQAEPRCSPGALQRGTWVRTVRCTT